MAVDSQDPMEELFALFRAEGREHVDRITDLLLELESGGIDAEGLEEVFRAAHSLKGAASTLGVDNLADVAHAMEDIFGAVRRKDVRFNAEATSVVLEGLDVIKIILERATPAGDWEIEAAVPAAGKLRAWLAAQGKSDKAGPPSPPKEPKPSLPSAESPPEGRAENGPAPVGESGERARAAGRGDETVRVPVSKLDAVLGGFEDVWHIKYRNDEYGERLRGIAGQSRLASRSLNETVTAYLRGGSIEDFARRVEAAARQGAELERDLRTLEFEFTSGSQRLWLDLLAFSYDVNSLRMSPLRETLNGFRRMIRDLSLKLDKPVQFAVEGEDNELDKAVIELIRDPLNHILRNALHHGLESAEERAAAGKPREGYIAIVTARFGSRLVISVEDDGGGLDLEAVKRVAVEQGLIAAEAASALADDEAARLIFEPGITTSRQATELGGRGVGLNVVATNVAALGGSVDVWTERGVGTRFTLQIPLTLAMARGMIVSVGKERFIIPSTTIRRVEDVAVEELEVVEGRTTLGFGGRVLAVGDLAVLLGVGGNGSRATRRTVLILSTPSGEAALAVGGVGSESEFLTKDLGSAARYMSFFTGAHVTGKGEVLLILNADSLVRAINYGESRWEAPTAEPSAEVRIKTVLVVDDSLTTRALEKNILEAAGFRVVTATNGEEALQALADIDCDVAIVDVQMPRMDGFELTRRLRASTTWRELPIILVTSLDTQADVTRGLDAGADAYVKKSQFDQRELLSTIEQLI